MNPVFKNVLALIAGAFIGGIVNMGLITISGSIISPPVGVNPSDIASVTENSHLFEPKHYIFPFLAHALGTLVGAFIAAKFSVNSKMTWAIIIGIFFLIGGITAATMIPAPNWFVGMDLILAYLPMAWIGGKLAGANKL